MLNPMMLYVRRYGQILSTTLLFKPLNNQSAKLVAKYAIQIYLDGEFNGSPFTWSRLQVELFIPTPT